MAEKSGLPLVEQPDILHDPNSAFMAAYLEWAQHGRCNAAANRDDVTAVRKIINGGSNGLAECRAYLAKVKKVLADYHASPVATLVSDAVSPQGDGGADAELLFVQKRLKAMNCNPGIPTGIWGGMRRPPVSVMICARKWQAGFASSARPAGRPQASPA